MATANSSCIIKLVHDHDAESPREWDNLGLMVCAHRRYRLGDENGAAKALEVIYKHLSDKQLGQIDFDANHIPDVERALEMTGQAIMLPLYLYDHCGITMKTTLSAVNGTVARLALFLFQKRKHVPSLVGNSYRSRALIS